MGAVLASAQPRNGVTQAERGDALELGVSEVEGEVLGRCAIYGTISRAAGGEETGLLLLGKIVPDGLRLEVVKYRGETTLNGFDFVV